MVFMKKCSTTAAITFILNVWVVFENLSSWTRTQRIFKKFRIFLVFVFAWKKNIFHSYVGFTYSIFWQKPFIFSSATETLPELVYLYKSFGSSGALKTHCFFYCFRTLSITSVESGTVQIFQVRSAWLPYQTVIATPSTRSSALGFSLA